MDANVRRILNSSDFYEMLEVKRDCDEQTLKRNYRRVATYVHPDRCKDIHATEAFQKVSKAYQVILHRIRIFSEDDYIEDAQEEEEHIEKQENIKDEEKYDDVKNLEEEEENDDDKENIEEKEKKDDDENIEEEEKYDDGKNIVEEEKNEDEKNIEEEEKKEEPEFQEKMADINEFQYNIVKHLFMLAALILRSIT